MGLPDRGMVGAALPVNPFTTIRLPHIGGSVKELLQIVVDARHLLWYLGYGREVPMQRERPQKTGGSPSLGCDIEMTVRSIRWLRTHRRARFERHWGPIQKDWRVWMRCENEECFNPLHMEKVTVWEMGRRMQKRAVTPAKERRKW